MSSQTFRFGAELGESRDAWQAAKPRQQIAVGVSPWKMEHNTDQPRSGDSDSLVRRF